jgi:hypothetical protein
MALRLLKKDEIAKAQANDKAKEIAEGLKIARKVDGLRELKAKEEETLEKFRIQTLSAVTEQISKATAERDSILTEVKFLREERARGLTDIHDRQHKLTQQETDLVELERFLDEKALGLRDWDMRLNIREEDTERSRLQTQTHLGEAQRLHLEADRDREEADKILWNANQTFADAENNRLGVESYYNVRKQELDSREKMLLYKEDELNIREKELTTLKIQLADQRATIERELQRLKKHG